MTWMAGLRRRMWLTAAASLLAALAALALALVAASDGSRASRQLSGRLLPAAAQAGALAADYTAQRAALRDYAVDRQPQALRAYRETSARIPALPERFCLQISTGAAQKRFWVKTPATREPGARRTTSRSFLPGLRIPAMATPSSTPGTG